MRRLVQYIADRIVIPAARFGRNSRFATGATVIAVVVSSVAPIAAKPTRPDDRGRSTMRAASIESLVDRESVARCTMAPAASLLLLQIDRDTTIAFGRSAAASSEVLAYTSSRRGGSDTMTAQPGTPMPAARTTLLDLDSTTRAALVAVGIQDAHPHVFIQAAPYGSDCRTVRYLDPMLWVTVGDTGFVRGSLLDTALWIGGTPVFVVREVWNYPYPTRKGQLRTYPSKIIPASEIASAAALFGYSRAMAAGDTGAFPPLSPYGSAAVSRAIRWARERPTEAERQPIRDAIRSVVQLTDMQEVRQQPSAFRGTYRVTMTWNDTTVHWQFRTAATAAYTWHELEGTRPTRDFVRYPHVANVRLAGFNADSSGRLLERNPTTAERPRYPLVWLATSSISDPERVTPLPASTSDTSHVRAELMFVQAAAPQMLWDALDELNDQFSTDTLSLQRLAALTGRSVRAMQQPRVPIVLRVRQSGAVRGDTVLIVKGRPLRVILERVNASEFIAR